MDLGSRRVGAASAENKEEGGASVLQNIQSTKDLPIKQIEREAYHKRKERYGTHHVKEHEAGEVVGADLVEKAAIEKEEKTKSRGLEELSFSAPPVIDDFHQGAIQKIPDRDLALEK